MGGKSITHYLLSAQDWMRYRCSQPISKRDRTKSWRTVYVQIFPTCVLYAAFL